MDILYIDHYDSFSYNIIDWLRSFSSSIQIHVIPFDQIEKDPLIYEHPMPIVLSPGPGHPANMLQTVNLAKFYLGKVPIFGICLGHQILAHLAGFGIHRSEYPAHGMTKSIHVIEKNGFFKCMPEVFDAASYHSLIAKNSAFNEKVWKVSLRCSRGEIQGLESCNSSFKHQAIGVQFHPESFLSSSCDLIRDQWLSQLYTER